MSGSSIYKPLIVGMTCLLLVPMTGCFKKNTAPEEKQTKAVVDEEPAQKVDPLALAQDIVPMSVVLGKAADATQGKFTKPVTIFPAGDRLTRNGGDTTSMQVFRVQLLTIETYSDARRALAVAQEIFDQPVSLDYEVPYYKLRAGEFRTRQEAEAYQQKAKAAGYPNAWVILSSALIRQIQPMYQLGEPAAVDTSDNVR